VRWVVGDVHGCALELDRLLREIRFDPQRDELWAIGDLVNTGPESLGALRLWRDVGGRGVLGNHDIYAVRVFDGSRPRREDDTLDELLGAPDAAELLDRLRNLPILAPLAAHDDARPAWLVHAGLHPRWDDLERVARRLEAGPRDDTWLRGPWVRFATRVRCCTTDGEMNEDPGPPEDCALPYRPWEEYYRGSALVVHGHWATRGAYRGPTTMSLDSGCVYGGPLTAWCHEEDRVVQVPSRRAAQGRNR
jgi:bis(5'-nucleosyl)-tetraphosphatase (symmetrical)